LKGVRALHEAAVRVPRFGFTHEGRALGELSRAKRQCRGREGLLSSNRDTPHGNTEVRSPALVLRYSAKPSLSGGGWWGSLKQEPWVGRGIGGRRVFPGGTCRTRTHT